MVWILFLFTYSCFCVIQLQASNSKRWPGTLGKTANFAVVYARMNIQGKDHGVQPFLLQIRSLENHVPLKGITVGDIGPKYAFGYAKFR